MLLALGLAKSWEISEDGLEYTFELEEDVTFHDGEPFNAEAVCFNFDRWFNFTGSFQNPSASYYWQTVFGGFAETDPDSGAPEDSFFESCEAVDEGTVAIRLTSPSSAILGALSLSNFSIASPVALQEFGADDGEVDEEGIFHPTGTFGTEHPIGTGPFKFVSWTRGESLALERNEDYWGEPASIDELIFRPIPDNAARLQALQSGEIQGYDLVEPQDISTIEGDESLQVLDRPPFNVGRGEVAHAFMPPDVIGYADDVTQYEYDPEAAQQLLQDAGVQTPVEITFCYPTDVSRPYMPDPQRNFEAIAADLNEAGFRIEPRSAPWSPDYLGLVDEGRCPLYLLGWTGDFGDPDNFVGTLFQNANRLIMDFLPGVPYVHTAPALAFAANIQGYVPSPVSLESFASVTIEE